MDFIRSYLFNLFLIFLIILKINSDKVVIEIAYRLLRRRHFFYFNYQTFATFDDLLESLCEIHPELVNKEVIIKVTECFNRRGNYIPKHNHLTYKVCLPSSTRSNSLIEYKRNSVPVDGVSVTFAESGKKIYRCNRKTFSSLNEFTKCAINQHRVSFGRNCERVFNHSEPANCVGKKDKPDSVIDKSICEKPNTIYLLRLDENYKRSKFSNKIWAEIWSTNYNFLCFSKNNYRLLRQRYLMEINAYRGHHHAPPLFEDITMSHVAQCQAEEISKLGKVVHNSSIYYEVIVGHCQILEAPFMIKKWYEENHKYKIFSSILNKNSNNFAKLIWKKTGYLGIGIAKKNCEMIIVVLFKARKKTFVEHLLNVKKNKKV